VPPDGPREGLVINVPEMRLYDFTQPGGPEIFGVAVGDGADPTPLGSFRVGEKRVDPVWRVPDSIREERPELPALVPPGPDNPLGGHWITIGATSYGIHGTNNRWSIGREATHGCVRLYEDEMERLFRRTRPGTPIHIVYQTVKWGRDRDAIVLEVHPDLYGRVADPLEEALRLPRELGLLGALDLGNVERVVAEARGFPVVVGRRPLPAAGPATSTPTS
jgi:L,D-transpeptidase ErfK/SrfK